MKFSVSTCPMPMPRRGWASVWPGGCGRATCCCSTGRSERARRIWPARSSRRGDVPSPSFTLVQCYDATPEIWHADLYRLTHPDEVIELGLEEAFDTAICLVEWPDRLGEATPKKALLLRFSLLPEGEGRRLRLLGGADWRARLAGLEAV